MAEDDFTAVNSEVEPVVELPSGQEPSRAKAPLNESSWARYVRCTKLVLSWGTQLGLVYCFEYIASSGMAAKADDEYDSSDSFAKANAYAILSFCYQLGVLLSRSSLTVAKIRRVEILTILQLINAIFWSFEAYVCLSPPAHPHAEGSGVLSDRPVSDRGCSTSFCLFGYSSF